MRLSAALLPGLVASLLLVPVPAQAEELDSDQNCIELENLGTEDTYLTQKPNVPLDLLGIEEAQALVAPDGGLAGAGTRVAVVDSGVDAGSALLDVVPGENFANRRELLDYHGTAVAGLVAGRPRGGELTGVAPGAQIVDVRVYDDDVPDEGAVGVEPGRVVAGLEWVADNARRLGIGVAVVALRMDHSDELEAAVRRLYREEDVVVVAASGNRPTEDTDELKAEYGELKPGEDVAEVVYPAGYRRDVVAVSATVGGHPEEGVAAEGFVLQNSAVDVAAPTYGGVSLGLNGSTCLLPDVATSWAAAEVAGVVALLRARYDRDNAQQIVARLRQTASGSPHDVNVLTGAGVVQPVEALKRRLTPDRSGDLGEYPPAESTIPRATPPEPEPDLLAEARDRAVWWGLLGGAAVVLALLLRPVLTRRRG